MFNHFHFCYFFPEKTKKIKIWRWLLWLWSCWLENFFLPLWVSEWLTELVIKWKHVHKKWTQNYKNKQTKLQKNSKSDVVVFNLWSLSPRSGFRQRTITLYWSRRSLASRQLLFIIQIFNLRCSTIVRLTEKPVQRGIVWSFICSNRNQCFLLVTFHSELVYPSCLGDIRDRRGERHLKWINHLTSLISNIFSDKCS